MRWKVAFSTFLALLSPCVSSLDIHLVATSAVTVEELMKWIRRFPAENFRLYTTVNFDVSSFLESGYKISVIPLNDGLLTSLGCPSMQATNLCVAFNYGGMAVAMNSDVDLFQLKHSDVTAQPENITGLIKRKKKSDGPCSWCINGSFVANKDFIISGPKSKVLEEAMSMLNKGEDIEKALTLAAKRNLSAVNFSTLKPSREMVENKGLAFLPYGKISASKKTYIGHLIRVSNMNVLSELKLTI